MRVRVRSDGGFSLVEVVAAMSVFTILAGSALGILVHVTRLTGDNHRRVVAANLANRQMESARAQRAVDITDGRVVRTETVGGTRYTVTQTANFVPTNSSTSVCAGTGNSLAYKLISVTVTWPNMGPVKAVRADTLRAVGIGTDGFDTSKGTAAVSVVGARGEAMAGVTVTLSPGSLSRTTGEDGCAVFTALTPATYSVTASQTGYVGSTNTQSTTVSSLGVVAGTVARGTMLYDEDRAVAVTLSGPAGFAVPAGLPLMYRDTYLTDRRAPVCTGSGTACVSAVPGTASYLFPAVYDLWVGSCNDARHATAVDLTSAGSDGSTVAVGMASARVTVKNPVGQELTGRAIYAVHAVDAPTLTPSCLSGESYTLPVSAAGGVGVLLPYGTWTFSLTPVVTAGSVTAALSSSTTVPVTLVATS